MHTLYLIRGIPGSGKSTLGTVLIQSGVVSVSIEADDYFVRGGLYNFDATKLGEAHSYCKGRVSNYLAAGLSVAVTNTSTTEKEVAAYKELADKYDAKFVSIIVENRHDGVNVHNVPQEKLEQMKNRFSIKL